MGKKILTIGIFLILLAISFILAGWYWNKYMSKPKTTSPSTTPSDGTPTSGPSNTPPPSPQDANIGKEAYAGENTTIYDLNGSKVKNVTTGTDIGKVTGSSGGINGNFIIDEKYSVSMQSVITR